MAAITSDRSRSEQEARGQREYRSKHALVTRGAWPGGKAPWGYAERECFRSEGPRTTDSAAIPRVHRDRRLEAGDHAVQSGA